MIASYSSSVSGVNFFLGLYKTKVAGGEFVGKGRLEVSSS